MLITIYPLLVAIIGLLLWVLASNPKLQEIGKILFFCGVLVTLAFVGGARVHIG